MTLILGTHPLSRPGKYPGRQLPHQRGSNQAQRLRLSYPACAGGDRKAIGGGSSL